MCASDGTQVVRSAAVDVRHRDICKMVGRIVIQPEQESVTGTHWALEDRTEVMIKGAAQPMSDVVYSPEKVREADAKWSFR